MAHVLMQSRFGGVFVISNGTTWSFHANQLQLAPLKCHVLAKSMHTPTKTAATSKRSEDI